MLPELDELDPEDTHVDRRWVFDCLTKSEFATQFMMRHQGLEGSVMPTPLRYAKVLPSNYSRERMDAEKAAKKARINRQKAAEKAKETRKSQVEESPTVVEPSAPIEDGHVQLKVESESSEFVCNCGQTAKSKAGLVAHQRSCNK